MILAYTWEQGRGHGELILKLLGLDTNAQYCCGKGGRHAPSMPSLNPPLVTHFLAASRSTIT